MSFKKAAIIVFLILLVDQITKVYIKTNFLLGESIQAFGLDWFEIRFVENEGAAWGTIACRLMNGPEPSRDLATTLASKIVTLLPRPVPLPFHAL